MTKKIRKNQQKLNQIDRELLKLDKKLQKMETDIAVLPPELLSTEKIDKEVIGDEQEKR